MSDNFSRLIERPILVYKLNDSLSFDGFLSGLLERIAQDPLVSASAGETLGLIKAYQPEILFYLADNEEELLENGALFSELSGTPVRQIALIKNVTTSGLVQLYEVGLDQVLPIDISEKALLAQLDKILNQSLITRRYSLLNGAINSAGVSLIIADTEVTDSPIVYVNSAFQELTGYSRDEILNHNCRVLQRNDRNQPNLGKVRDAINNHEACSVLLRNYHKDGSMFWNELNIAPLSLEGNEGSYIVGVPYNVTQLVEPLHDISKKQAELQEVMEVLPAYIWTLKSPNQWTFMNEAGRQLVGDPKPASWASAVHKEDMAQMEETLELAWKSSRPARCELRILNAKGQTRLIQHTFTALRNESGQSHLIVGSGFDVTEFRNTEKLLTDRQRYTTALSLLQRSLTIEDPLLQLRSFTSVISEALFIQDVQFIKLPGANDFSKLSLIHLKENQTLGLEACKKIQLFAGRLIRGEACITAEGNKHQVLSPLMINEQCHGVIWIIANTPIVLGRLENDFLRSLRTLLVSCKFWK